MIRVGINVSEKKKKDSDSILMRSPCMIRVGISMSEKKKKTKETHPPTAKLVLPHHLSVYSNKNNVSL